MSDKVTLLTYLTIKGCQAGGKFWEVHESILARSGIGQEDWDLNELQTWEDWEKTIL